jgi:hypothetical protein
MEYVKSRAGLIKIKKGVECSCFCSLSVSYPTISAAAHVVRPTALEMTFRPQLKLVDSPLPTFSCFSFCSVSVSLESPLLAYANGVVIATTASTLTASTAVIAIDFLYIVLCIYDL